MNVTEKIEIAGAGMLLEVFPVGRVVVVRPFLAVVDAQPLVRRGHPAPRAERALGVEGVRVTGDHVGRDCDLLVVRDLALPEVVDQRVTVGLGDDVFFASVAPERKVAQLLGEATVGHPAAQYQIAVGVAHPFPGVDRGEVRRLLGRGEPLGRGQVRRSAHRDFASAPVLPGEPFDEVVRIASLLLVPQDTVPSGLDDPADVRIADRVALLAPVRRVGAFELVQTGNDRVVQADEAEHAHCARRGALPFAVGAERHDHRNPLGIDRAKNVHMGYRAIAERDRHVLVQCDVDRQGTKRFGDARPGSQDARARREVAEQAVTFAAWLQWPRRHEDLFAHRTLRLLLDARYQHLLRYSSIIDCRRGTATPRDAAHTAWPQARTEHDPSYRARSRAPAFRG